SSERIGEFAAKPLGENAAVRYTSGVNPLWIYSEARLEIIDELPHETDIIYFGVYRAPAIVPVTINAIRSHDDKPRFVGLGGKLRHRKDVCARAIPTVEHQNEGINFGWAVAGRKVQHIRAPATVVGDDGLSPSILSRTPVRPQLNRG